MDRIRLQPSFRPPESPCDPMEFLCRSWSLSAREISKAIAPQLPQFPAKVARLDGGGVSDTIREEISDESDEAADSVAGEAASGNSFPFASSETSLLVLERIMSQSQDVSPRTSGRLSHSSGPLNGGQSCGSFTDSPPVSPSEIDASKYRWSGNIPASVNYMVSGSAANGGGKTVTVGRWFKDRKEKKKGELRAQNAQLHAAISVAGVASAIAAIAAATAASSGGGKDEQMAKTDMALASAATLVAAQCVEAAEAMGAEREHLASVVSSAVNVRSSGDIMTLTAAAATALRAAATLKARTLKDVWNIAAVIPVEKGIKSDSSHNDEAAAIPVDRDFLARGSELLKKTRKGDLHWKIVSVYINRSNQVMLKMKSKHVAGTVTKKKKNVVLQVMKEVGAWPGRHLLEGGDEFRYFGLRTLARGVVEFECRDSREYEVWTQGVDRLLAMADERKNKHKI